MSDGLSALLHQKKPSILLTEILPKNVLYPLDKCELVLPNYELYVSLLVNGRGVAKQSMGHWNRDFVSSELPRICMVLCNFEHQW